MAIDVVRKTALSCDLFRPVRDRLYNAARRPALSPADRRQSGRPPRWAPGVAPSTTRPVVGVPVAAAATGAAADVSGEVTRALRPIDDLAAGTSLRRACWTGRIRRRSRWRRRERRWRDNARAGHGLLLRVRGKASLSKRSGGVPWGRGTRRGARVEQLNGGDNTLLVNTFPHGTSEARPNGEGVLAERDGYGGGEGSSRGTTARSRYCNGARGVLDLASGTEEKIREEGETKAL